MHSLKMCDLVSHDRRGHDPVPHRRAPGLLGRGRPGQQHHRRETRLGHDHQGRRVADRHPHPVRLGRRAHPRHLPLSPVLAAGPPDREEEGRRGRRSLHPGDLPSWSAKRATRTSTPDGPQPSPGNDHWRAVCVERRPYHSGRGRRKRTRTTGTSPAAYFTRGETTRTRTRSRGHLAAWSTLRAGTCRSSPRCCGVCRWRRRGGVLDTLMTVTVLHSRRGADPTAATSPRHPAACNLASGAVGACCP